MKRVLYSIGIAIVMVFIYVPISLFIQSFSPSSATGCFSNAPGGQPCSFPTTPTPTLSLYQQCLNSAGAQSEDEATYCQDVASHLAALTGTSTPIPSQVSIVPTKTPTQVPMVSQAPPTSQPVVSQPVYQCTCQNGVCNKL